MADQNINEEDLQPLLAKHAARAKYPLGCPVWYGVTTSSKQMDTRQATVESVYIHLEAGERVYKVKGIDGLPSRERSGQMVWEHQLAYAMDCPVKVKGMAEGDPKAELDGTIVCPKPGRDGVGFSYSVRFFLGGDRVRLKLGVDDGNIAFRKEERIESTTSPSNLSQQKRERTILSGGHDTGGEAKSDFGQPSFEPSSLARNPTSTESIAAPDSASKSNDDIGNYSARNRDDGESFAKPDQVLLQRPGQVDGTNMPLLPIEMPKVKPPATHGTSPYPLPPTSLAPPGLSAALVSKNGPSPYPLPPPTSLAPPGLSAALVSKNGPSPYHLPPPASLAPPGLSAALVSKRKREPPFGGRDVSPQSGHSSFAEHPQKMPKVGERQYPARPVEDRNEASRFSREKAGGKEYSRASATSKLPANVLSFPDGRNIGDRGGWDGGGSAVSGGGGNFGILHPNEVNSILIRVPLWLQRDRKCQDNLFFHLIGSRSGTGKRTVMDIGQDRNCNIRVNFESRGARSDDNRPIFPPMTITVRAHARRSESAQTDLGNAHREVQDLLLDYIGDDGSRARLIYEVGLSRPGDHRPEHSACGAVRASDPFGRHSRCSFIAILPLPFHSDDSKKWGKDFHAAHLINGGGQRRIHAETGGHVTVVHDDFGMPVALCEPFLLLMGSSVRGIDRAAEIVREINEEHVQSAGRRPDFHKKERMAIPQFLSPP